MQFYAFRLDKLDCKNPRGKIPDSDIVTFNVFVNQVDRGHGAGVFDVAAGSSIPAAAVTPCARRNMSTDWIVGPMEIAPGDLINVVYSGSNTSDSQLDLSGQGELEIKILNFILGAAVGEIGGPIGSALGDAISKIGDPVGKFLGYSPHGPCNGLVFSDVVDFSGAGLDNLAFQSPTVYSYVSLPDAREFSFTRPYTDEATHDSGKCGEVAHTEITFSVLRVPFISVRHYLRRYFPGHWGNNGRLEPDFSKGLRQLAPPKAAISVRSLLRVRI